MSIACLGGWHFLRKGVPNLQKVGIDKTATPYSGNKNFMTPHHRYTLKVLAALQVPIHLISSITGTSRDLQGLTDPKQAKIVLKSVFLNKINTLSVVIL